MIPDSLQYFVGKICTVLTHTSTLRFKDAVQHAQYFTGEVISVDNHGIWIRHPQSKAMGFFQFPIVGIVEEQQISPNELEKIKQSIKKPPANQTFVPVDDLTKMIRKG